MCSYHVAQAGLLRGVTDRHRQLCVTVRLCRCACFARPVISAPVWADGRMCAHYSSRAPGSNGRSLRAVAANAAGRANARRGQCMSRRAYEGSSRTYPSSGMPSRAEASSVRLTRSKPCLARVFVPLFHGRRALLKEGRDRLKVIELPPCEIHPVRSASCCYKRLLT